VVVGRCVDVEEVVRWMLGYNCVYDVGLFTRKSLYQKANCLILY